MARERRTFSEELKQEAVRLVTQRGVAQAQAPRDLGIDVTRLRAWVQAAERTAPDTPQGAQRVAEQAALAHLQKEVATLRMERDIVKRAAAYFAKELM
ncbi:MAG: transposase [Gemmatimonadaceae bacterium]